jgi:carbon-monoxide dehydrogenase medium subunit
MLQPFELVEPDTVAEASAELSRRGDSARVYAGGVELLLLLRQRLAEAECLVNIKRIPGLDTVRWDGQAVRIGATVTHRRLEWDELIQARLPLLAAAERRVGNIRVRTQGTLGGNLCFADPHADPGTALLIHEARVVVGGASGARELPLEDFLLGTYTVALEPDEVLTEVIVPPLPPGWRTAYLRLEQFYRPTLNVAAAAVTAGGRVQDVKLAVGCIGPKPVRLRELEALLRGAPVAGARGIIDGAREYLTELLEPVEDLLGSVEYKLHVARVYLRRALEQAAADG